MMAARMPIPGNRKRGMGHKYFPVRYMTPKQLLEESATTAKKRATPFRTKKQRALLVPAKTPKVIHTPVAPTTPTEQDIEKDILKVEAEIRSLEQKRIVLKFKLV